jgi:ribosome-binding ATPase YchF (GTP1/OBG family)
MRIGIVGAPSTGKTTLLCALTHQPYEAALVAQAAARPREGVARLRDARLEKLRDHFKPRKFTPAPLDFQDTLPVALAGPDRDKNRERLPAVKEADALLVVAAALEIADPVEMVAAAKRQLADLRSEFLVADLSIVEKRMEKLRVQVHKPTAYQAQDKKELALLERLHPVLNAGQPIASCPMAEEERKLVRGFRFISEKPVLVALNVPESLLSQAHELALSLGEPGPVSALSARLELELAQFPDDERAAFMADYGLERLATPLLVEECFRLLGLIHFFTVGEDEVRAWTLHLGEDALAAAGKIHSDLARGFIAAEVYGYADWDAAAGNLKEIRAHGHLRTEGKHYPVKDGDVINIKFNV